MKFVFRQMLSLNQRTVFLSFSNGLGFLINLVVNDSWLLYPVGTGYCTARLDLTGNNKLNTGQDLIGDAC